MSWSGDLTDWIDDIESNTNADVEEALQQAFERVLELTPVDTGRLKSGWVIQLDNTKDIVDGVIFNDVPYAAFVNDGTIHQEGQHMAEIAFLEIAERLRD